ncbi:MAG: hypothetical protein IT480_13925 [Gammaproteobacteria bacterium]|nr:hypothetical protein [Gammaproteobacteria bacterium]
MKPSRAVLLTAALACCGTPPTQAAGPGATGPLTTDRFHATFIRLGAAHLNGLLYEPTTPGPDSRIALVYAHPRAAFDPAPAEEMANRGYRVLMVRHYLGARRGVTELPSDGVTGASRGIDYVRSLPGVERVVLMGWGMGARLVAFYANVAEHGPAACQQRRVLHPCQTAQIAGLARPDGIVMFDPDLGALSTASTIDPAFAGSTATDGAAVDGRRSRTELDLYAAANGYDALNGRASYPAEFRRKFFAAQSARNNAIIDRALARVKRIDDGKGQFDDDEAFTVPGAINVRSMAGLQRTDLSILSRTKRPHTLLKAGGTTPQVILHSIRPATGIQDTSILNSCCEHENYTVRRFLANDAVRTTRDFALTADDVIGVDWMSSNSSTPSNAAGISLPTLIMAMTCSEFVVSSEIVYDHLAAQDRTLVAVEGAGHLFQPCTPQYGDTRKRTFDFLDTWLSRPERF